MVCGNLARSDRDLRRTCQYIRIPSGQKSDPVRQHIPPSLSNMADHILERRTSTLSQAHKYVINLVIGRILPLIHGKACHSKTAHNDTYALMPAFFTSV